MQRAKRVKLDDNYLLYEAFRIVSVEFWEIGWLAYSINNDFREEVFAPRYSIFTSKLDAVLATTDAPDFQFPYQVSCFKNIIERWETLRGYNTYFRTNFTVDYYAVEFRRLFLRYCEFDQRPKTLDYKAFRVAIMHALGRDELELCLLLSCLSSLITYEEWNWPLPEIQPIEFPRKCVSNELFNTLIPRLDAGMTLVIARSITTKEEFRLFYTSQSVLNTFEFDIAKGYSRYISAPPTDQSLEWTSIECVGDNRPHSWPMILPCGVEIELNEPVSDFLRYQKAAYICARRFSEEHQACAFVYAIPDVVKHFVSSFENGVYGYYACKKLVN